MAWEQSARTVDLGTGLSLAFVEQGDRTGPRVLLLHPWGESLRCFERLAPLLPPGLHVLAMDQRGHGDASKPPYGYDLETLGADITGFMDAVGVSSAILVGSSSGGYVAQQVASRNPERVAGLVLIGSPRTLQGRPEFADQIEQLSDPIDPNWARDFIGAFHLRHDVPRAYLDDRVRDALRIPAQVWRSSLAGLTSSPAPIETGRIQAPTLIVWGDQDELLPRDDQRAIESTIPNSRLLVYEGVGHLVLWEQPQRVATDLIEFVRNLTPSG